MNVIAVAVIDVPPDVIVDTFTVANNEDWVRNYQVTVNGAPVAIESGWKIYMQMQGSSKTVALNASLDNQQILLSDAASGKFSLHVRASDSTQVLPDTYTYDIVLVAGDGIYRLAKGSITVEQGITIVPGQEMWTHVPLISRP
jgi:hypothetical protein